VGAEGFDGLKEILIVETTISIHRSTNDLIKLYHTKKK
jgi:hypothetical protein